MLVVGGGINGAVSAAALAAHGAVSIETAEEMAAGVRRLAGAELGLSTTGIAGPGGGTEEKPVGTVWIAVVVPGRAEARLHRLVGNREEIRQRAAQAGLAMLLQLL